MVLAYRFKASVSTAAASRASSLRPTYFYERWRTGWGHRLTIRRRPGEAGPGDSIAGQSPEAGLLPEQRMALNRNSRGRPPPCRDFPGTRPHMPSRPRSATAQ